MRARRSPAGAGLRLAVGTLTVLPTGDIGPVDRRTAGWAMALAPVAALPVALGAAAVTWAGTWLDLPPLAVGLCAVATTSFATRAMHLDGLADTVDGLGGGWTRERALEIMHRGDIGPMGVVALVVVLGLQAALIGSLALLPWGALVIAAGVVVGRASTVLTCLRGLPSARPTGMGATVAGTVSRPVAAAVQSVSVALLTGAATMAGLPWWQGALAGAVAALGVLWLLRVCCRRFGGVSGDIMGAAIELATTIALLVLAAGALR
ncbi:cobalamin-5'-phosphate synthase [Yimella lutea]|uniref:Adenosylcobinamide-GDP ribazoletransferase n=1 Tax=Yimella lutea TaxID=587872 RepID=A0A542ECN4_9MICO|nr:adenosylcobinamide-GDP ribazoletransferase [Yimella lutea]TQJ13087.1 cobalamin-5'-phosphate synthase [Yimella lutea]